MPESTWIPLLVGALIALPGIVCIVVAAWLSVMAQRTADER